QRDDLADLSAAQVEGDVPVEERDLEVRRPLVRRDGHRTDRGGHAREARLGELLADVPLVQDLEGLVADDLEALVALAGVRLRARRRWVRGCVDPPDARVEDPRAVLAVV